MTTNSKTYDLIIIGAGPAGYTAAQRAASLDFDTACIESRDLGGVCLNRGCIPTKALLHEADLARRLAGSGDVFGLEGDVNARVDWAALTARPNKAVQRLSRGVGVMLEKAGVDVLRGRGQIVAAGEATSESSHPVRVAVFDNHGEVIDTLDARQAIIATGARPRPLPDTPFDGNTILSSTDALSMAKRPDRLIVLGAGAIGVEFADFFDAFGTRVTVVEMLDRLLPAEDDDVSKALAKAFRRRKIAARLGRRCTAVEKNADRVSITLEPVDGGESETIDADALLVAIGVKPDLDGLFGDSLQPAMTDDGHLAVDLDADRPTYQTSVPGVHAVGDVVGRPWLAHVASAEATVCVEQLAGRTPPVIHYPAIPACTYCHPQVAGVGLTERDLIADGRARGEDYIVGSYDLVAHGLAVAVDDNRGMVKLIADANDHRLLGAHLVGHQVTECIGELALALRLGATVDDIATTIHAHPTMHEAIHEAALLALT